MSSPHNPYLDPSSPNPNIIRIPTDIPLPKNILFILEAQRQKSDTPNILSWKEVVCAGSDDLGSSVEEERKIEEAGVGGSVREGDGRRVSSYCVVDG